MLVPSLHNRGISQCSRRIFERSKVRNGVSRLRFGGKSVPAAWRDGADLATLLPSLRNRDISRCSRFGEKTIIAGFLTIPCASDPMLFVVPLHIFETPVEAPAP